MTNNRESIFNKVRALLSKTVENGCTEAEAMIALAMAEKMMNEHEIIEDDLKLEDEAAVIDSMYCDRDPHAISWKLCYAVGKFTETYAFGYKKMIKFAGLRSDIDFALWLTQTLTKFVQTELKKYMWANGYQSLKPANKRIVINGFVIGVTARISTRLQQMIAARATITNSTALVVAKNALIQEAIKDRDIKPSDNRGRKAKLYGAAYRTGLETGDKANFGRPVDDKSGILRLTKS